MNALFKVFVLLAIIMSYVSCDNQKACCVVIDTIIDVKFVNQDGVNLLETPHGVQTNGIPIPLNVYQKIDSEWQRYNSGIELVEVNGENYARILPDIQNLVQNISEMKLEFSETDVDIIKAEFNTSNSNVICTKVWYNDVLMWDLQAGERILVITK